MLSSLSMKAELEAARHRQQYVGVAELAAQAAEILRAQGLVQERGTVSDVPDERTVRYYLTEGLIAPADEKQGTASVFGYQHLLQLLVVKKLQAEHLPIRKIRELVEGRTTRELERLLGEGRAARKKNAALDYLETLLVAPRRSESGALHSAPRAASPPAPPRSASDCTWQRIEIEAGLELHVRGDYSLPNDTSGARRLLQKIGERIVAHQKRRK